MCNRSYERGYTGSMADDGSLSDLEELEKRLHNLLGRYSSDELRADSQPFCADFCQLVEQYTSRWHVPLPQLRILEMALSYFTQACSSFTLNCDHVLHTLSSLALSVFELLLFFHQKDLNQDLLKQFTATFQECYLSLERHQNVHLLQVERLVQDGGPWASSTLQAILTESNLPQNEVDGYIGSELPVFLELRVRYLLASQHVGEAVALAKCCAYHPKAGQHLFFLQVYLIWLYKTAQHSRLHKEVADISGEDAVHVICSLELEENDELLLGLSRVFLSNQLSTGDMNHLWDLVFIWTKLHSRLNTSKEALLEESSQLMLSTANVNSIFPFIRAILQELGEDGIQFCVELCANALESCLPCDVITKSLIYKTIAGLLPNDLEVCRACALLVFFLERTVEAYKMVYLLYMHPDQEYCAEHSLIGNHVRFETLQVLKKGLYFDPEFWNLIALRTNCLKLMSEKVVSAALEEIMEEKWVPNYCTKEPAFLPSISVCQKITTTEPQEPAKKRHHKEDGADTAPKRLKVSPGKTQQTAEQTIRKKGCHGSQPLKEARSGSLRRSFWQLGKIRDSLSWQYGNGEHRRTTRLSEKKRPKRKIRRPKWLLEDSGTLEENNAHPAVRRRGMKSYRSQKPLRSCVTKRPESIQVNNNAKHKTSYLKTKENDETQKTDSSVEGLNPDSPSEVILEISLPDNEVMGTFTVDACSRQGGYPQVLLYKPTVRLPPTSQPVKALHRNEVILRARDPSMFVHQLHCYARRQKGVGSNIQVSVSTITRSSVQGSPPKHSPSELFEKTEMKGAAPPKLAPTEKTDSPHLDVVPQATESISERGARHDKVRHAESAEKFSQSLAASRDLREMPGVEVKVSIASQSSVAAKVARSSLLEGSQAQNDEETTVSGKPSQTSNADIIHMGVSQGAATHTPFQSQDNIHGDGEQQQLDSPSSLSKRPVPQRIAGPHEETFVVPLSSKVMNVLEKTDSDVEVTVREVLSEDSKGHVSYKDEVKRHSGSADTLAGVKQEKTSGEDVVTRCKASAMDTPGGPRGIDMSALTLVTEMVTEIVPDVLGQDLDNHKELATEDIVSENLETVLQRKVKLPHRKRTTSSCSSSEHGIPAVADVNRSRADEKTGDIDVETPESSDSMETQESEESNLEYCCIFCKKILKGRRMVAHAMFHYRKDECMFCGVTFKDDLLAMMHLSDHIEKLKKSKCSVENKIQENPVLETKHIVSETKTTAPKISLAKTSINVNTTIQSSIRRGRGRPRKTICPKSESIPDQSPCESRELRSNNKLVDGQDLQQKGQKMLKKFPKKSQVHKLNGHIGKNKAKADRVTQESDGHQVSQQQRKSAGAVSPRLLNSGDLHRDGPTPVQEKERLSFSTKKKWQDTPGLRALKGATKQNGKAEENNTETRERICCPMDGCPWYTDQSRNRVSFLYHALEEHHGDAKPLELAFSVANNKCGICMRVLWSFQHFLHHIERHRLSPRHPCLHQGCTARFKTGNEMRRHARRHSPLQAVCCLPGCPKLFICLWALNLHEREHYASKRSKTVKKSNFQTVNKCQSTQAVRKPDWKTNDHPTGTTVDKTPGVKAALRSQTTDDSKGKPFDALPLRTLRKPLKPELKARRETDDSSVWTNRPNKNTSARRTTRILRLRLKLRKRRDMRTTTSQTQKFFSMSLLKPRRNLRHKLQKKQVQINTDGPRRRGRPRGSTKLKKAMLDESTAKSVDENTNKRKTRSSRGRPPTCRPEMLKTLKVEVERSQWVKEVIKTTASINAVTEKSQCNSVNKQIKKNRVQQRKAANLTTSARTQKLKADREQMLRIKRRVTRSKAGTDSVKKNISWKKPSDSKRLAKPESQSQQAATKAAVVASSDDEKFKEKNGPGSSEKAAPPTTSNETQRSVTNVKLNKSHFLKKCLDKIRELQAAAASSKSNKPNEKHQDVPKELAEKNGPRPNRTAENDAGPVQAQQETSESTPKSACDSVAAAAATSRLSDVAPPAASPAKEQKMATVNSKHSQVSKKLSMEKDPQTAPKSRNANQKHKVADKKSHKKSVKKKCPASEKPSKSKTEVHQVTEAKAAAETSRGEERDAVQEHSVVAANSSAFLVTASSTNGDATLAPSCSNKLSEYRKAPYRRAPPTAYLDEKYISMPKRRKELAMFPESSRGRPSSEQAAATASPQRHRCANCFVCFNSRTELQSHLQLQSCSSLFGFDSDDDANS